MNCESRCFFMFIKITTLVCFCLLITVPVLAAQSTPAEEYAPVCRYQNDCPYYGDCGGRGCYDDGYCGPHRGCRR